MDGPAAGLIAVVLRRDRSRARIRIWPPGDRLTLSVRPRVLPLEIAQFVKLEIRRLETRAALKPDHLHAGLAKFGSQNASGCAHANNHDIGFFGGHGSTLSSLGLRAQAHDWTTGECLLAAHLRLRKERLRAGELNQLPTGEVLVAAIDRVGKHALHGVSAKRVEESGGGRPGEPGGLVVLQRLD